MDSTRGTAHENATSRLPSWDPAGSAVQQFMVFRDAGSVTVGVTHVLVDAATEVLQHGTPEFVYMIRGSLEFMIGDRTGCLSTGDCIEIPCHTRHQFHNCGSRTASMLFALPLNGGDGPSAGNDVRCGQDHRIRKTAGHLHADTGGPNTEVTS